MFHSTRLMAVVAVSALAGASAIYAFTSDDEAVRDVLVAHGLPAAYATSDITGSFSMEELRAMSDAEVNSVVDEIRVAASATYVYGEQRLSWAEYNAVKNSGQRPYILHTDAELDCFGYRFVFDSQEQSDEFSKKRAASNTRYHEYMKALANSHPGVVTLDRDRVCRDVFTSTPDVIQSIAG